MLGYVTVCQGMLGYVRVCQGMLGYVRVCQGMSGYVRVCQGMSGYVRVCVRADKIKNKGTRKNVRPKIMLPKMAMSSEKAIS
jgi:ribosomal 30S subunit maturation factor RimM